jgi:hypothetical protein
MNVTSSFVAHQIFLRTRIMKSALTRNLIVYDSLNKTKKKKTSWKQVYGTPVENPCCSEFIDFIIIAFELTPRY